MTGAKTTCSIDGCEKPMKARTWCAMHYWRNSKHGSPVAGVRAYTLSAEESFAARTERDPETGCLLWTGAISDTGYGTIVVDGRSVNAHRYAWEREHGPIAPGILIDHADCYNHACVEITHLREATKAQNTFNRSGATRASRTGIRGVFPHPKGGYVGAARFEGEELRRWFKTEKAAAAWVGPARDQLESDFAGRG